jgi:hypothetical protein
MDLWEQRIIVQGAGPRNAGAVAALQDATRAD